MIKGTYRYSLRTHAAALALGIVLHPSTALAATGAASDATSSDSASTDDADSAEPQEGPAPTDEIVVTATRRSEALQRVPIAVSVFGREALREVGADNIGGVLQLVPGFNFSSESSYRSFATLRGVQGGNEDAAIAMYYDGVYIGQDVAQNLALIDPESIQVLRGPQGALYGKSTLGGAVIVTTRAPLDEWHANGSLGFGNYGAKDVRGTVTGPLIARKLDVLVSGYYAKNDGTFWNGFLNRHVNFKESYGFQGTLKAEISDRFSLSLSGDYNHDSRDIGNYKSVFNSLPQPPGGLAPGLTNTSSTNVLDPTLIKIYGVNLTAKYDADAFTLTSISAYRGYNSDAVRDADFSGANATIYQNIQRQRQYSQDIFLSSPTSGRFSWIMGAQYYYSTISLAGLSTDYVGNNLLPFPPSAAPVNLILSVPLYKTYSVAAYAQADYRLTDTLKIAAGIRYSNDHREFEKTEAVYRADMTAPALLFNYNQRGTWSALTPEASISYQPIPEILAYAKYSRSYRPGGFNVNGTFSPTQNAFGKEGANAYELGVKTRFLDGRATVNLTAFQLDWQNQQVSYTGTLGFTTGNTNSRSRGVELEASLTPVEGLKLDGNVYYLDATFGPTLQNYRDPVTRAGSIVQVGGTPLLYSPKWSASGAATYTTALSGDWGLLLRASANYRSSIYIIPARKDLVGPGYTRIDLRAEVNYNNKYYLAFYAKNLLNEFSYYFAQTLARVDGVGVTEPRTYGAQLSFRW